MDDSSSAAVERRGLPLYVQVLLGVAVGICLGLAFGQTPYAQGLWTWTGRPLESFPDGLQFGNAQLGAMGLLVIRLLTALATPLIFFAILDAFVRTDITGRQGARLIGVCLLNVAAAMTLGLCIMALLQPGLPWRGRLVALSSAVARPDGKQPQELAATLSPLDNLKGHIPDSALRPFLENNILAVVLVAILLGAALRAVPRRQQAAGQQSYQSLERFIDAAYQVFVQVLSWIVRVVPFAVLGTVAMVVGESGVGVFRLLWVFLLTVLLGLGLHALVYYPLSAWLIGRKSPRVYLGRGADAIGTGFSINSSLATVPVTLGCLDRMGVTPASARLSACVGTNFNNDGITLYEAMTALFVAQAAGYDLTLAQQVGVVLASLMASVGVAGVPASGLIVLPLVLKAAGLPDAVIAVVFPIIMTVDWLVARVRSAVNVMGDMQVAILLDRWGSGTDSSLTRPTVRPGR